MIAEKIRRNFPIRNRLTAHFRFSKNKQTGICIFIEINGESENTRKHHRLVYIENKNKQVTRQREIFQASESYSHGNNYLWRHSRMVFALVNQR